MANCGIYTITCTETGKVYVGSSINLKNRLRSHRTALTGNYHVNKHLQTAWNKYGKDNFIFEVIENCSSAQLPERELFWIIAYFALDNNCGFNKSYDTQFALRGYKRNPDQFNYLVKQWIFIDPTGKTVDIKNLKKFGRDNKLSSECLWAVHKGKLLQYKGWRKYLKSLEGKEYTGRDFKTPSLKTRYVILSPEKIEYKTNDLASFCKSHNLNRSSIAKTVTKARTSCYGWVARKDTNLLASL